MNNSFELAFLRDDADENEGLGEAGIETYKDAIYAGIAREAGQNSADAWQVKPVKMRFDVIDVKSRNFPSLQKITDTVKICLRQAIKEKNEKSIDFFKRAQEVLETDIIKVLRVADYNTKGLRGPCEKNTPFHSLVKGSGISVKESSTSGGSFGIGKNAAFAVSELQTVFYSSQYRDSHENLQFIAQGKSLLVSHTDEKSIPRKSKGYWGLPEFKAVEDISKVPEWLQRKEQGTSIFSIGFRLLPRWQYKMAASLVSNFFCAIHRGDMEFSVNDSEIEINKNSLPMLFESPEIKKGAEDNNSLEEFEFAKDLFDCLVSARTGDNLFDHPVLGQVSIKILVAEGFPKRLAFIRNGMLITDNLDHFGDKFIRFPMSKEFVAIVEAQEEKGNELIKKLENPRHDGLSAERISDSNKRDEANTAMKQLIRKIREAIRNETTSAPDNEVTVDELTEFFADDSLRERSDNPEHPDDLESFTYLATDKTSRPKPRTPASGEGTKGTKGLHTEQPGNGFYEGSSNGDGKKDKQNKERNESNDNAGKASQILNIDIRDVRNIVVREGGRVLRRIFFTSPLTCETWFTIEATGIDHNEDLTLVSASDAIISDNKAMLPVTEGERTSFDVEFAENYNGPIEVFAFTKTGGTNENQ